MPIYSQTLFIEINNFEFIFAVGDISEQNNFKIIYKVVTPIQGITNHKITDFDLAVNIIKKNIYLIEQKINFTFKNTILVTNIFNCSFINLTGFKKLNGSQVLKENITYILNSIKSTITEIENKKTILHIFNTNHYLDKKKIENLPIGLFGDFYSHELSLCLIQNNDYKNLTNIFDKCNLKIKKIFLKSFTDGTYISNKNEEIDTFYQININQHQSQIFYFENDSLKFEQNFDFGSDLVIRDISKVTSLKPDLVNKILHNVNTLNEFKKDDLVEKNYFENENENYIKIKKNLLFDIAEARIDEILKKIFLKNINLINFNKKQIKVFLKINDKLHLNSFRNIYSHFFSNSHNFDVNFIHNASTEDLMNNVNKIVNFGWKREAIPITHVKKSLIARFFDLLFE
jgi:cell division protein FtsA